MKIIFCENSIIPNNVDEAFIEEYNEAKNNGFDVLLYNFEENVIKKYIKNDKLENIIYRGWMLTPSEYEHFYNNLLTYNYKLINDPIEYRNCHYLPDSLGFIEKYTPKTIFQKILSKNDINLIIEKTKIFEGKPIIVKDYVKSEKHYWNTACFVEKSNDYDKLIETINNFIELRGDYLNEGIVIREYVELNNLTTHSKSGMPLSEEYHLFFYKNELLSIYDYWEEGNYDFEKQKIEIFEEIGKNIKSNFFTMDIAKLKNRNFTIIELGDGQVSGIPENANVNNFYRKIKEKQNVA